MYHQVMALIQMSVVSAPRRWGSIIVTLIGVACAVGVLVSMLSMGAGLTKLTRSVARPDRIVVLSRGAQSLLASNLERATVLTVSDSSGIRKHTNGKPLVTAASVVVAEAPRKGNGLLSTLALYGADQEFFLVFPEIRLISGRMFRPGVYEVIVGRSSREQFNGLENGNRIRMRGIDWTIVGQFEAGGALWEHGLIADANAVAPVYKLNTRQFVSVVLQSSSIFPEFKSSLQSNPAVRVDVSRETEALMMWYDKSRQFLNFVAYVVGAVMAAGATLGAMNVIYTIVDNRQREFATLRAIGFGVGSIITSVLIESLVIAITGGLVGGMLAMLFFDGDAVSPLGVSLQLTITTQLLLLGMIWAIIMGLLAGLIPAFRAARVPIATALRAI